THSLSLPHPAPPPTSPPPLHDALPICEQRRRDGLAGVRRNRRALEVDRHRRARRRHARKSPQGRFHARHSNPWSRATKSPSCLKIGRDTSELQSLAYLVCRLLLEKKKK